MASKKAVRRTCPPLLAYWPPSLPLDESRQRVPPRGSIEGFPLDDATLTVLCSTGGSFDWPLRSWLKSFMQEMADIRGCGIAIRGAWMADATDGRDAPILSQEHVLWDVEFLHVDVVLAHEGLGWANVGTIEAVRRGVCEYLRIIPHATEPSMVVVAPQDSGPSPIPEERSSTLPPTAHIAVHANHVRFPLSRRDAPEQLEGRQVNAYTRRRFVAYMPQTKRFVLPRFVPGTPPWVEYPPSCLRA